MRSAFEKKNGGLGTAPSVMDGDRVRLFLGIPLPQRDAGVGAIFAEDIVGHVDELEFAHIIVVIAHDALERVHASFERRHAAAHVFDDSVGAGDFDVLLAAARRARRAYILIGVASGADDGRITATAGEFEGEAAGGGAT